MGACQPSRWPDDSPISKAQMNVTNSTKPVQSKRGLALSPERQGIKSQARILPRPATGTEAK